MTNDAMVGFIEENMQTKNNNKNENGLQHHLELKKMCSSIVSY